MKTQAILACAGSGIRLKTKSPKPFVLLDNRPLFIYALKAMEKCPTIDSVIVVGQEKYLRAFELLVRQFRLKKVKRIVAGGQTRYESVKKGLAALDCDTEIVVIHDAARPFVTPKLISQAVSFMKKEMAVVVGVPVKPTIKKVDPNNYYVQETIARETLWETQTPQVFKKAILLKAHELRLEKNPTDDAVLVERMGVKVKMVMGDYQNIKITTPEDLAVAKMFLNSREKRSKRRTQ